MNAPIYTECILTAVRLGWIPSLAVPTSARKLRSNLARGNGEQQPEFNLEELVAADGPAGKQTRVAF